MQIKSMIQAGAMVLTLLSLTACGFGLRGISETGIQLVPTYSHVNIITENNAVSYALKHKLETQMAQLGVVSDTNAAHQIQVSHLRYREYKLLGVLSEIRLVLTADIIYQMNGQTIRRVVQAERSYQYNEAGVSTKDQQGEIVKVWLQDSLAHRIAEQYYALGSQIHTP